MSYPTGGFGPNPSDQSSTGGFPPPSNQPWGGAEYPSGAYSDTTYPSDAGYPGGGYPGGSSDPTYPAVYGTEGQPPPRPPRHRLLLIIGIAAAAAVVVVLTLTGVILWAVLGPDDRGRDEVAGTPSSDPATAAAFGEYGSDPLLDRLYDTCRSGDNQACDELYMLAPRDSGYETYGDLCGTRGRPEGTTWCDPARDATFTATEAAAAVASVELALTDAIALPGVAADCPSGVTPVADADMVCRVGGDGAEGSITVTFTDATGSVYEYAGEFTHAGITTTLTGNRA